jgi:hypothetical protein
MNNQETKQTTIGITGHRDIIQTSQLKQDIKDFFFNFYKQNKKLKLLSPLADGADRLVATIYMEIFQENAHLIVPMPFTKERYIEDFNINSKKEFLAYLKISKQVIEVSNTEGCPYKSVGVYVANQSDILLALWDGTFNHKSGGTGDIVQYARDNNREVIHFFSSRLLSS